MIQVNMFISTTSISSNIRIHSIIILRSLIAAPNLLPQQLLGLIWDYVARFQNIL